MEIARAECSPGQAPGEIDLAALFSVLWSRAPEHAVYAQVYHDDEPLGPAVVLQPMTTPVYAPHADRDGVPAFVTPPAKSRAFTGYRAYVDKLAVFETSRGRFTVAFRPDAAPNTAWTIRGLVAGGFYTDILVHRVASLSAQAEPDVVQFGDPSVVPPRNAKESVSTVGGTGGAGFMVDLEPSTLKNDFGVVSLARGRDPNSGSSQIVIALSRERCASMDGRYAAFGEVVEGAEVLLSLAHVPVDAEYRTLNPPVITSAKLVDAPPFPKKPGRVTDPSLAAPKR